MSDEQYDDRIEDLFARADGLSAEDLACFLDEECGNEPPGVRQRVEMLLAADRRLRLNAELPAVDADVLKWLQPRYALRRLLGEGAMGQVYLAFDYILKRYVAIKVNRATKHIERLEREARSLAQVNSSNVTTVYDFGRLDAGRSCVVMQWIDGRTLSDLLAATGAQPTERVHRWMIGVCNGMRAVESASIVHRDLKPGNIIVDAQDDAIVTDFGLAHDPTCLELTHAGSILGTPYYIAPEQIEDCRTVDARADVYSFGATFYHVLTGTPPFSGDNIFDLLLKHKIEPLEPPKCRKPSIPNLLNDCLERCLAKHPADRFSSFSALLQVLQSSAAADPWQFSDELLQPFQDRYRQVRAALLNENQSSASSPVVFDLTNGKRLTLHFGNLAAEQADAIVSSDDYLLTMGGGVSRAICHEAGPVYETEAGRLAPARRGRVVVTSAGNLAARYVFHAITIDRADGKVRRPTRDIVAELVDACFYHAETHSIKSLAFSLLGTGVGGLSSEIALDTMFNTIVKRLLLTVTPLIDVRIVLWASR
jgi:serine/threonine protein kinase